MAKPKKKHYYSPWDAGAAPQYVWLSRKQIGTRVNKKTGKGKTRLLLGSVAVWTFEPLHEPNKWVCYRLVSVKSKRQ